MTPPHPPPRDLDAVWRWCSDLVDTTTGDLPYIGSPEWVAADEQTRVASMARFCVGALAEEQPHMIAYRLAVELTCGLAEERATARIRAEIQGDIHGARVQARDGDRRVLRPYPRWHRLPTGAWCVTGELAPQSRRCGSVGRPTDCLDEARQQWRLAGGRDEDGPFDLHDKCPGCTNRATSG